MANGKKRSKSIAQYGSAPSISTVQYNSRAVSVLSYVGQFGIPPETMFRDEMVITNSILHLPPRSLSLAATTQLSAVGMVQPKSAIASALAANARAASNTLKWQEQWDTMSTAAQDALPMSRCLVSAGSPWPDVWKTPAIAANLRNVALAKVLPGKKRINLFSDALAIGQKAIHNAIKAEDPKIQRATYKAIHTRLQDVHISLLLASRWNDTFFAVGSSQWNSNVGRH